VRHPIDIDKTELLEALLPRLSLAGAVSTVTSTLMGRTFRMASEEGFPMAWRTAVLPIPGPTPLAVALSSDRRGCAALAAAMLSTDEDDLELGMIDDFLRELVNMTAGQIKRELGLDQALGLPRVLDGEDFFRDAERWAHHVLRSDSVVLVVSLTTLLVEAAA
jgi:Chemotaxis phosphatase CheX